MMIAAKILGSLIALFQLLMLMLTLNSPFGSGPTLRSRIMSALLILALAGYGIAWKHAHGGALLMVLATLLMIPANLFTGNGGASNINGSFLVVVIPPLLVAGLFWLAGSATSDSSRE